MPDDPYTVSTFQDLHLPPSLLSAVDALGYEIPSPIQAQTIPHLLNGKDLLGHAPTGTGKTAAFALPLLSRLDTSQRKVQIMVLTPTQSWPFRWPKLFNATLPTSKGSMYCLSTVARPIQVKYAR